MKHYWTVPDHDCRECKELDEFEIIEMQSIDADCNDCFFFDRGQFVKKFLGLTGEINLGRHGYWTGHCRKFDKPTIAQPGKATAHECFEHRKTVRASMRD